MSGSPRRRPRIPWWGWVLIALLVIWLLTLVATQTLVPK
jgi:hypothetical protein